jgi:hypothetical protein
VVIAEVAFDTACAGLLGVRSAHGSPPDLGQAVEMASHGGDDQNEVEAVLASYDAGVRAIERIAAGVEWDAPTPCGEWRSVDLVGHLLAIVRYYHRLLDAASTGNPRRGLPRGSQLVAANAEALDVLTEVEGDERAREFVVAADAYADRLRSTDWTMTLGAWSGLVKLTVGQHTGVVLGEWHVHAWDLARSAGLDHQPDDPTMIAKGQEVVRRGAGPSDPWIQVLKGYGRDPDWSRSSERNP